MSFNILRIQKIKGSFITGIQIHNQREKELQNKEIDKSRTTNNYDIHNAQSVNYNDKFKKILADNNIKKVRSTAVKSVDILTTSDTDFFKNLSKNKQELYFQVTYDFISKQYSEKNIIASVVHLDEKTPHMHTTIVPITKDGRLSARDLFNPNTLRILQTEYHSALQRAGFDMERGIKSNRKHIDIHEFKKETLKTSIKKMIDVEQQKIPFFEKKETCLNDFKADFKIKDMLITRSLKIDSDSLKMLHHELNSTKSSNEYYKNLSQYQTNKLSNVEIELYAKKQEINFYKNKLKKYVSKVSDFHKENKITNSFERFSALQLAKEIEKKQKIQEYEMGIQEYEMEYE